MLSLVNILIIFFIFLISYQIILANRIIEGLENNSCGSDIACKAYQSSIENSAKMNELVTQIDNQVIR